MPRDCYTSKAKGTNLNGVDIVHLPQDHHLAPVTDPEKIEADQPKDGGVNK